MATRTRGGFPARLCAAAWLLAMLMTQAAYASGSTADLLGAALPVPNPYLVDAPYAITHFNAAQTDSMPYGLPRGTFTVDPTLEPVAYGGPINIITLSSTDGDYLWGIGTDRVSYIHAADGQWRTVATFAALADASDGAYPAISDANLRAFGQTSAAGMTTTSMDGYLKSLLGADYKYQIGNGTYVAVDNNNVLYANYADSLYAFALKDPNHPADGITVLHKLDDVVAAIEGGGPAAPAGTRLSGISMSYDGHLVLTLSNGVAVLDRDLSLASKTFYRFADSEYVSNSIAVDEDNGIYVASNQLMRKLVWTGTALSDQAADGAWSCPYATSSGLPPIIKVGNGTGSTPTLMGFGDDADKLVVITDGSEQMKLVAFWRDGIPDGFVQKEGTASRRIADQIQVTCGFGELPQWLQSEQSVVVNGYGAFVVNNIPETVSDDLKNANKILQVSLMGPAYPTSYGVERLGWDPDRDQWSSVWSRSDVSSTSMVPAYSQLGDMVLVNGYTAANGWEVDGLDWQTGATVHQTVLGQANFGNGAYAILQTMENGDLLFNSIAGPLRIHYPQ